MTEPATPILHREMKQLKAYDARDLMPDGNPVNIILDEQTYCLRITRAGKLILTK